METFSFAISESRRNLGRVYFRKDLWERYREQEKNWPIADRRVPSTDPKNNCGTQFSFSSRLASKVANGF